MLMLFYSILCTPGFGGYFYDIPQSLTPSSVLTLRLSECYKDIWETKDMDIFFCFSQMITVSLSYRLFGQKHAMHRPGPLEDFQYSSSPEDRLLKLFNWWGRTNSLLRRVSTNITNDSFYTSLFLDMTLVSSMLNIFMCYSLHCVYSVEAFV